MNLTSQKRMAADVLGVGKSRVWIDPDRTEDVEGAITKNDIRNLIESGAIDKKEKSGVSRGRARKQDEQRRKGRKSGHGRRKGKKGARRDSKEDWKNKIRSLRSELKRLRDEEETIDRAQYRKLYNMASGGFFRNKKHMHIYIEKNMA